jgi:peptidoglycan/LPS O-acetylase OafA/YrhL
MREMLLDREVVCPASPGKLSELASPALNETQRNVIAPTLPRHIPSLDGLRAISIALVLLAHVAGTRNAPAFLDAFFQVGNLGVKVFFEISGFLITTLLLRELSTTGQISLKDFYLRRAFRIVPACYVYILVIGVLSLGGIVVLYPNDMLHAITYTMNYHIDRSWYLNHLWSLAVEEQFYLLWPLLVCLIGWRRGLMVAAGVVLLVPFIRFLTWCYFSPLPPAVYTRQFQAVADGLATGCLLAGGFNWLSTKKYYLAFLSSRFFFAVPAIGLLFVLMSFRIHPDLFYVLGQSLVNLLIALCIDRCVRFPAGFVGRVLNAKPIVFLGALSYSLYLWQEPFLNPHDETPLFTAFPWNLGFAFLAALASYYLIERPFLKLKTRFARN